MEWVPRAVPLNVVDSVAVAPANVIEEAPLEVTVTGLPICVVPSRKVTVPVGPSVLTLLVATVAVSMTGEPAVTVADAGAREVVVLAGETVIEVVAAAVGAL